MSNNKQTPGEPVVSQAEQEKLLEDAKQIVNIQSYHMKRSLDNNKLMEALKHASNMVCELRTGLLSPKYYYELYILALDQLRYLEMYLAGEKHGKSLNELYELVQYAGNILPRLYLLVTVGSVYIKSKKAPAKDVLLDLVEMCRGVQHPTRGLFLRNYLSEMTKDKLPDEGSEYSGWGGSVKDSIDFIVSNFVEMNKLWVRMQHQGPVREREKREQERKELCILVGKNLSRLSQLDGLNITEYKEKVLPKILEQIVQCKDKIAQQYLMEIVIQVFSDDFHLQTLDQILLSCGQLNKEVEVKTIIISLIDRLANYASKSPQEIPKEIKIFDIFYDNISKVFEAQGDMPLENIIALEVSLLNLSLRVFPTIIGYVDRVLGFCAATITKTKEEKLNKNAVKEILRLLQIPLNAYKNVLMILKLENYQKVMSTLDYADRKKVSIDIAKNAIENDTKIPDAESVEVLFKLLNPLVKDEDGQPPEADIDSEDFEEEQNLVARLLHLFNNNNETSFWCLSQS
eukprot:TRINITY_DN7824_c0_g1_i7.p1 TRINITY_DN7824_c0_g1~~TRINITY_DN7824_c0_g1_i7.p1  ORF type:complete len:515 (-),score=74.11 TRINITY_DN7824_c0_g1_i7:830-2374(-)